MSFFHDVPLLPEDPILGLPIAFKSEKRPEKINLGIGSYKTVEGHPLVLSCVRKAESIIFHKHLNKEYLPIEGDEDYLIHSLHLLFGAESPLLTSKCYYTAQAVGGAGALRVGGEFLAKIANRTIFLPQPTWVNHKQIFERTGLTIGSYPYFDPKTGLLDFKGMYQSIEIMPENSVILLHGCCQNPTGVDPSFDQWKELSSLLQKQKVIPFFDIAYQGFGQDLDIDAQAIRYFAEMGHEMLVAYSYSKNLGLYGERVGFLTVCCSDPSQVKNIGSQIKYLIRSNYSNPPLHGARVVSTILNSPELSVEWKNELSNMRERVREMRKALVSTLLVRGNDPNFSNLAIQQGLFCYLGLNAEQVNELREKMAIYMPSNGRINIAGLTPQNIDQLVDALYKVIK